ncbi:hypothetical protein PENSPDRAFT_115879 [Peniophora sp. CONT]|nr:hypothetical protein PENSPDRAFT_115879 [Peniophora sp. CONT]
MLEYVQRRRPRDGERRRRQLSGVHLQGSQLGSRALDSPQSSKHERRTIISLAASADKRHELGSLSVIPPEIIIIVFSHLSTIDDVVCFAISHRLLGQEGFRRVVQLRHSEHRHLGNWFGARMVTAGEGTQELPKGMLTDAEEQELKNGILGTSSGFYHYASDHYKWAAPLDVDRFGYLYARDTKKPALRRVSQRRDDKLRLRLLLEDTSPHYDPHAAWALCNLNRKEYVRASAVANMKIGRTPSGKVLLEAGSLVEGPFVRGDNTILDLGTFTIILTVWLRAGETQQSQSRAGERLGIQQVERLKVEGWKDVSEWGVRLVDRWGAMNYRNWVY